MSYEQEKANLMQTASKAHRGTLADNQMAMYSQNKVLIMQNDEIIRLLKEINAKMTDQNEPSENSNDALMQTLKDIYREVYKLNI